MEKEDYKQLFIGGDLSGIQKFLYNITSRHASVSLKGRSAYLSNYLRKVCNRIEQAIESLGGTYDELYCSGGKFYLTSDNSPDITLAIDECAQRIKEDLWNEHWGQLGINISYVPFTENVDGKVDVYGQSHLPSGELWRIVNTDFVRQKNQKFRDVILTHYEAFFDEDNPNLKVGGKPKVCAVTGVESDSCRPLNLQDFKEKGLSQEDFDEEQEVTDDEKKESVYLPSVIEQIVLGKTLAKKHHTKTFEQYADGSYLGILRMDVDGMGKRFIIGFDSINKYREFSKKVTNFFEGDERENIQSAIEKLLLKSVPGDNPKEQKFRNYLSVIYAGGDDLFIVGRWDKVIDFAKMIHDAVACPNAEFMTDAYNFPRVYVDTFERDEQKRQKYISISGGIAIVKPKFPIAKAADLAGKAEDAAKSGGKNAFCMFGKVISWNDNTPFVPFTGCDQSYKHEYDYVESFKNLFVRYIQQYEITYGFSKSLLHKLMLYSSLADENKDRASRGKPMDFRYVWHMTYFLTRYMEKFKNFKNEKDPQRKEIKRTLYNFCKEVRDKHLAGNNGRNLELIALAARWAELQLKAK